MSPSPARPPATSTTRQRLLDAAARVFARNGLEGATTREISREAGVNEVTLFRHFQSKEKLLAQVVQTTFARQEETLTAQTPAAAASTENAPTALRAELRSYAHRYAELLERNLPLLRTLIGEIHRHREHELCVFKGIFTPLKTDLIAAIQAAQSRDAVRADIAPLVAADLFGGMIFTEVIRRNSPIKPDYSTAHFLAACVDVFARGIEQTGPPAAPAAR